MPPNTAAKGHGALESGRRGVSDEMNEERHICARRRGAEVAGPEQRVRPPYQASLEPPRSFISRRRRL